MKVQDFRSSCTTWLSGKLALNHSKFIFCKLATKIAVQAFYYFNVDSGRRGLCADKGCVVRCKAWHLTTSLT